MSEEEKKKGTAHFNFGGSKCDNCGDEEHITTYNPKTKKERQVSLCHACIRGFVICVHNAGLLE